MNDLKLFGILATISISLIAFICGTSLSYFLLINNNFTNDTTIYGSYISGIGSFLGGLFGGVFAYLVAKAQILNEKVKSAEKERQTNSNLLKAIKIELQQNIDIFDLVLEKNDIKEIKKYCLSLEDDVWSEIRFQVISIFDLNTYSLLSIHFNECKDLKKQVLPEYQNLETFNFGLRKQTAEKLLLDIEEQDGKLSLPIKKAK